MATTVTVLCPNGRRVNIKVTPATTLLQVGALRACVLVCKS